jgi:hypothetical protein
VDELSHLAEPIELDAGFAVMKRSMDNKALVATLCEAAIGQHHVGGWPTDIEAGDDPEQADGMGKHGQSSHLASLRRMVAVNSRLRRVG